MGCLGKMRSNLEMFHSDYVKSTIVEVQTPQQLSDREINILYNSCDVGCNNCNGGGYELTVFECLGSRETTGILLCRRHSRVFIKR